MDLVICSRPTRRCVCRSLADSRGVVAAVARLGEVVEDLLAAADPRADDLHDAVDVAVLVADMAASASAHAAGTGVTLTVDTGPGAVVQGSGAALRRAVLALVDNALEHTPRGGSVDLRVWRDRRCVRSACPTPARGSRLPTCTTHPALPLPAANGPAGRTTDWGSPLATTSSTGTAASFGWCPRAPGRPSSWCCRSPADTRVAPRNVQESVGRSRSASASQATEGPGIPEPDP